MRLGLQVLVLVAVTVFLALQIPRKALFPHARKGRPRPMPYAAYVELGKEEYADRMKLARMAWQVRARAAGRLDLEDGTPLVEEAFSSPAPSLGFPSAPPLAGVSAEPPAISSLAPPSVAAPDSDELPPPEDRRRDALLDLSSFETLSEKETKK